MPGYAPALYQVCQLPLGWKAVVMESASIVTPGLPNIFNVEGKLQVFGLEKRAQLDIR